MKERRPGAIRFWAFSSPRQGSGRRAILGVGFGGRMEGTIKYQDKTLRWDVIQEPTEPVWWVHVRLDRCAAGRAVDSEPTEEEALCIAEDLAPTLFLILKSGAGRSVGGLVFRQSSTTSYMSDPRRRPPGDAPSPVETKPNNPRSPKPLSQAAKP